MAAAEDEATRLEAMLGPGIEGVGTAGLKVEVTGMELEY